VPENLANLASSPNQCARIGLAPRILGCRP
jgi:hypothetical protein